MELATLYEEECEYQNQISSEMSEHEDSQLSQNEDCESCELDDNSHGGPSEEVVVEAEAMSEPTIVEEIESAGAPDEPESEEIPVNEQVEALNENPSEDQIDIRSEKLMEVEREEQSGDDARCHTDIIEDEATDGLAESISRTPTVRSSKRVSVVSIASSIAMLAPYIERSSDGHVHKNSPLESNDETDEKVEWARKKSRRRSWRKPNFRNARISVLMEQASASAKAALPRSRNITDQAIHELTSSLDTSFDSRIGESGRFQLEVPTMIDIHFLEECPTETHRSRAWKRMSRMIFSGNKNDLVNHKAEATKKLDSLSRRSRNTSSDKGDADTSQGQLFSSASSDRDFDKDFLDNSASVKSSDLSCKPAAVGIDETSTSRSSYSTNQRASSQNSAMCDEAAPLLKDRAPPGNLSVPTLSDASSISAEDSSFESSVRTHRSSFWRTKCSQPHKTSGQEKTRKHSHRWWNALTSSSSRRSR